VVVHSPTDRSAFVLVRLPILIVLVALGTRGVVETDIWGHMRFGLDFLSTHTLPTFDRYNFTSTQPWVNLEWLSDLLFGLAFKTAGLPGLALLRGSSLTLALLALARGLRGVSWPWSDLLITAVVFISLPLLSAVRPQIFSVPLYALTLLALERDAAWLPLVFVLWANLHGGWLLGLGAVVTRAIMRPTKRRSAILTACVLSTLVTPYGFSLWRSLADALTRGWGDVLEWQPIWTLSVGREGIVIWGGLTGAFAWAAYRRLALDPWEWVWTVCVALASARARRHIPFYAITLALLVFAHIRVKTRALAGQKVTWQTAAILAVPVLAAFVSGLLLLRPTLSCLPPQEPPVRPESNAVQFIKAANLRGRLLMWFDWGLYAIWQVGDRLQVSYDNRRETVYSSQTVSDHLYFYFGQEPTYADDIRADYAWLPSELPVVDQLTSRGWFVLFRGPRSVILGREYKPLMFDATVPTKPCFPDP
jgi:hypothetical protein